MATEIKRIQLRRDTIANWTTANPILAEGEYGYETDTGYERIGDGSTAFLSLPIRTGALNGKISLDSVSFDTGAAYAVGEGEMAWNAGDNTLDVGLSDGTVLQMGQEMHIHAKAAEALTDAEVVYASGAVGASGKIEVSKFIADNSVDEIYMLGVVTHDIASGAFGYITTFGAVRGVPTDGAAESETWIDGTVLYASPTVAGKLTNVIPVAPNQAISVAMVIVSHASNGTLYVRPSRGLHISELHDVHAPAPSEGDTLKWATDRWVNVPLAIVYDDYDSFAASTEVARPVGSIVRYGQHSGVVVASGGDIQNSAGTPMQLDVLPSDNGWFNILASGANGNGVFDNTAIIQAVIDKVFALGGGTVFLPAGHYITTDVLFRKSGVWIVGEGRASFIDNTSAVFLTSFVIVDGWLHEADWATQTFYDLSAVTLGGNSVTTATAGDASNFTVGELAVLYRGFPGHSVANNAIYSEIVRVQSVDAGTGVVGVDIFVPFSSAAKMGSSVAADWDVAITYADGDLVWHVGTGHYYASLVGSNLGNAPTGATDANWQVETVALTLCNNASSVAGIDCYLCDGGGIENISVRTMKSQWQARSAVLEATYRNVYVEESDTLLGGNAFNRCTWENITGNFRRGALEFAEGAYKNIVTGMRGVFIPSASTPIANLITCSRDGVRISDFILEVGDYEFSNLITTGSKTETAETVISDGIIKAGCSAKVINIRAGLVTISKVLFVGDGGSATRTINFENRSDKAKVIECDFHDYNFTANIVHHQADAQATEDIKIDGNRIFKTALTSNTINLFGRHGQFTNNYIEGIGGPAWDGDDLKSWTIHGNTKLDGESIDNTLANLFGSTILDFTQTKVYVRNAGAVTITLPDVSTIPLFHEVSIYNADGVVTNTTDTFGSEQIQPKRTGGAQNSVTILPQTGDTYWWDGTLWLRSIH